MRRLARTVSLVCAITLSLAAAPVQARNEEARAKFESAQRAYRLGSFEEALGQYEEAYRLDPRPAFLFNIGQCHRQVGRWERAIFFFNQYLDAHKEKAPKNKALVLDLLRECEREQAAKEQAAKEQADKERAERERLAKQTAAAEQERIATQQPNAEPTVRAVEAFSAEATPSPAAPGTALDLTVKPMAAADPAVAAGPDAAVSAEAERPVWQRWWFWTAVGAVAAGAVAGGVWIATTPEPQPTSLGTRDLR